MLQPTDGDLARGRAQAIIDRANAVPDAIHANRAKSVDRLRALIPPAQGSEEDSSGAPATPANIYGIWWLHFFLALILCALVVYFYFRPSNQSDFQYLLASFAASFVLSVQTRDHFAIPLYNRFLRPTTTSSDGAKTTDELDVDNTIIIVIIITIEEESPQVITRVMEVNEEEGNADNDAICQSIQSMKKRPGLDVKKIVGDK